MQFINIVVHSVENMNFRVFLQYEFTHLGLDLYLEVSPVLRVTPRSPYPGLNHLPTAEYGSVVSSTRVGVRKTWVQILALPHPSPCRQVCSL